MANFNITQFGKPLDKSNYTIDLQKNVFYSKAIHLVLDFTDLEDWSFRTGNSCTFQCVDECYFNTGITCTFKAYYNCTFTTGSYCTFYVAENCTFNITHGCTFNVIDVLTHTFVCSDGHSIILDSKGNRRYVLTGEFLRLMKIARG